MKRIESIVKTPCFQRHKKICTTTDGEKVLTSEITVKGNLQEDIGLVSLQKIIYNIYDTLFSNID